MAVHRYTCTRPLHGNVHSVYGPRTRLSTWLLPGCVKARYGRVHGRVRAVHAHVHGRVPGRFRSRTQPVRLHASAVYTARRRRTTVLYTARVHLYTCTRPCAGRVLAVSARVNGRVRAVYTTARVHVYTYTAVNGPCTRPCMGRVNPCTRPCTCRLDDGPCTRRFPPCTGRVHGRVMAVYTARVHVYTCTRSSSGRERAVYGSCRGRVGPCTRSCTCRIHDRPCVRGCVYGPCTRRCTRPCTGRAHGPCTPLCTGRVEGRAHGRFQPSTRRVHGRVMAE